MTFEHDVNALRALRHPEPHRVLGMHSERNGLMIRAWRPDAVNVTILPDDGGRIPMRSLGGGLFEVVLTERRDPFPYTLETKYAHGATFELRDPYSFLPTLGELDLHLLGEGRHERVWERLGAHLMTHQGVAGVAFATWAPNAASVSVVGDFNSWDGRIHPMRVMGSSGIWEIFVPGVGEGMRYKFEVRPQHSGPPMLKADPYAFRTEAPPQTASVVHDLSHHLWHDDTWVRDREVRQRRTAPMSIYEVHLGSWRRVVEDGHRAMTYREIAQPLAEYVQRMGFTHVELMPVAEHPFGGSWGYQVGAYYAPTSRYGHPDDLRYLVDTLHAHDIGVLIDWVPAHFPRDDFALARYDGTALYEHADPRLGTHPDWGTLIFNYGRHEVRNFLIANALFWVEQYHVDGLRVDAVASMLYLDYSRGQGEWLPNRYGGRENIEAIAFLRELNEVMGRAHPGVQIIAEESTAWPGVTQSSAQHGLGFSAKWNMGWMHDTLVYFSKDPVYRRYHHSQLTFGMLYAYSEKFVLPLSHDEVVHGKAALAAKMPGDHWQKLANLRALFGWMWAQPGKKLLFMGGEFAQWHEWNHEQSLDWHLLEHAPHRGVQSLVEDLNRLYREQPALYERDDEATGFEWVQADSADWNVYAFVRRGESGREILAIANLSPSVHRQYRVGCSRPGMWRELLNTDATCYGGSGVGNAGRVEAQAYPWDHKPCSMELTLPPLAVLYLTPE